MIEHIEDDVTVSIGPLTDETNFFTKKNGPDISADEQAEVFKQGYTSSETGTGLGLSIVRKIVRDHGWEIIVTTSEDDSARFEITTIESLTQE